MRSGVAADDVLPFLRRLPLFTELDDADIERVAHMARWIRVAAGRIVIREGGSADGLYVLVRGRLEVTKADGGEEVLLGLERPGSFVGEMALLGGVGRTATVRAVKPSELIVIGPDEFRALLLARPAVAVRILRAVAQRLASTESRVLRREKLASLGTLAAGLAHELNNPAAAAGASALRLAAAVQALEGHARAIGANPVLAGVAAQLAAQTTAGGAGAAVVTADEEERLADWLRARQVLAPRSAARALAACGWDPDALASAARSLPEADVPLLLDWLAAHSTVAAITREITIATRAISDVVAAIRAHVHLDRAAVSAIDVRASIEAALVVLRSRWKEGVIVSIDVKDDVPPVEAHGGELSQVWSNLIGNAIDALDGRGRLRIRACRRGQRVVVEFEDDGPGIPAALRSRIFEPFFTTKAPQSGTGLGLHIARSIVVHGHDGRLDVRSRPGRTVFRVTLPLQHRPETAS
jgi:signal transduction histidine kinase